MFTWMLPVMMLTKGRISEPSPPPPPNPAHHAKPSVTALLPKSAVIFHSKSFSLCSWYTKFPLVNGYLMKSWHRQYFSNNTWVHVIKATWIWWGNQRECFFKAGTLSNYCWFCQKLLGVTHPESLLPCVQSPIPINYV